MSRLSRLGRAALAYVESLQLLVLPLLPRRKEPNGALAPHGFVDAAMRSLDLPHTKQRLLATASARFRATDRPPFAKR